MSDDLSQAFKALGDPHRLTIVRRLMDEALGCDAPAAGACRMDPACCDFASLAEGLGIGKSTVSHHLKELHRAGLIERVREGRRLYCRIVPRRLRELGAFLDPAHRSGVGSGSEPGPGAGGGPA